MSSPPVVSRPDGILGDVWRGAAVGLAVVAVLAAMGGEVEGEVARLTYELAGPADDDSLAVIMIEVSAQEEPAATCEDLPALLDAQTCEGAGPQRWLVSGPSQNGVGTQVLVADQDGARLVATDQVGLMPATLASVQISEVRAADLAALD